MVKYYKKCINGNEIQLADYPGEKGPIVAIHGLTGTHKNMHYYAERFKGEYRFISLDLRGRGNSDNADEDTSIFRHAEDIIQLLKELNIENSILMGHSMGAFISAIVASKIDTIKGVVFLDGAAQVSLRQDDIVKPSLGRLSKEYSSKEQYVGEIKTIYQRLGVRWNEILNGIVEYEVEKVEEHWENKSTESRILDDWESFKKFKPKEIISNIDCPMLLIYAKEKIGEMEPLFYLEEYKETQMYAKNLETIISDSNHYTIIFENRIDIYTEIELFFKKNKI